MITLSSREFNQETGRAKKSADQGPVFITDRGRPSYVLLSMADYRRLTGAGKSIADLLAMPEADDIELDLPNLRDLPNAADLS